MFSRKAPYPKTALVRAVAGSFRLDRVRVCRTTLTRLRGLLGQAPLASDEGCLLYPCASVHTFGMRYPIDVIYLSREKKVVKIVHGLVPKRLSVGGEAAFAALEVRAGIAQRLDVGDSVRFLEIEGVNG